LATAFCQPASANGKKYTAVGVMHERLCEIPKLNSRQSCNKVASLLSKLGAFWQTHDCLKVE